MRQNGGVGQACGGRICKNFISFPLFRSRLVNKNAVSLHWFQNKTNNKKKTPFFLYHCLIFLYLLVQSDFDGL